MPSARVCSLSVCVRARVWHGGKVQHAQVDRASPPTPPHTPTPTSPFTDSRRATGDGELTRIYAASLLANLCALQRVSVWYHSGEGGVLNTLWFFDAIWNHFFFPTPLKNPLLLRFWFPGSV